MKVNLFSVDFWKFRYPDIEYLKSLTDPTLLSTVGLSNREYMSSSMQTSAWSWQNIKDNDKLHNRSEFAPLRDFILEKSQLVWDELNYYPDKNPKIYQSWINVGARDGSILPHIHYGAYLAAVVYIDASANQGNFVIEDPMELALISQPIPNKLKRSRKEIEVNTGDVIIFPGYLKHYTMPNTTDRFRISFVANINDSGTFFNPYFPEDNK